MNPCFFEMSAFLDSQEGYIGIHRFVERKLLGSARTLYENRSFVSSEKDFLILYADNLTTLDLRKILDFHRNNQSILTMGVVPTDKPQRKGIISLDNHDVVTSFVEKPEFPELL